LTNLQNICFTADNQVPAIVPFHSGAIKIFVKYQVRFGAGTKDHPVCCPDSAVA
jgi:hypothetical protein